MGDRNDIGNLEDELGKLSYLIDQIIIDDERKEEIKQRQGELEGKIKTLSDRLLTPSENTSKKMHDAGGIPPDASNSTRVIDPHDEPTEIMKFVGTSDEGNHVLFLPLPNGQEIRKSVYNAFRKFIQLRLSPSLLRDISFQANEKKMELDQFYHEHLKKELPRCLRLDDILIAIGTSYGSGHFLSVYQSFQDFGIENHSSSQVARFNNQIMSLSISPDAKKMVMIFNQVADFLWFGSAPRSPPSGAHNPSIWSYQKGFTGLTVSSGLRYGKAVWLDESSFNLPPSGRYSGMPPSIFSYEMVKPTSKKKQSPVSFFIKNDSLYIAFDTFEYSLADFGGCKITAFDAVIPE